MKFRNNFKPQDINNLHKKLDEVLDAEAGFVIIGNIDKKRITDIYHAVCKHCVMDQTIRMVEDADRLGFLAKCEEDKEAKLAN